jgi:hypothetical protein
MSIRDKIFAFADQFHEKLSTSRNMLYILAVALGLIIAISLLSVYANVRGKSSKPPGPSELHYFCLESKKEFIIKPDFAKPESMMEYMDPMGGMRSMSPYTNRRTAVPMTQCPSCKKWYVPEFYKNWDPQKGPPAPLMGEKQICPYCQTDILEWYRQNRKKR